MTQAFEAKITKSKIQKLNPLGKAEPLSDDTVTLSPDDDVLRASFTTKALEIAAKTGGTAFTVGKSDELAPPVT